MKHVRGMLAQKQLRREEGSLPPRPPAPLNRLEFPKILERAGTSTTADSISSSSYSGNRNLERPTGNGEHPPGTQPFGGKKPGMGGSALGQFRGNGATRARSLNSSKTSLNRLVAEIYLQTKRKGRSFQPGQPPYTEQQLVRYVQLKVAILLEEQRKNKTEPCSKCQSHGDWLQDKNSLSIPPYLVPTVVMDRFNRLGMNGKKWKSVEQEKVDQKDYDVRRVEFRRKSLIPITSSSNSSSSYKALIGEIHIPGMGDPEPNTLINSKSNSIATAKPFCTINSRIDSRKPLYSSSSTNYSKTNTTVGNNSSNHPARAPSLRLHQKMHSTTTSSNTTTGRVPVTGTGGGAGLVIGVGGIRRAPSHSRPGSTSKSCAAKKSSVRCQACKKKIGIACRYQCRCGLTFCSTHRYPETHDCTFDYKTEGRNKIRENNPVIVAPKIKQI